MGNWERSWRAQAAVCLLRGPQQWDCKSNMLCPHRLASLKEVIIPGREKEDQAGFLVSAATYIRQLQV